MSSGKWKRLGSKVWPWGTAAVALLVLWYAMNSPPHSAFAIAAATDVIVVEPSCGDKLTWDLPPGWVVAENAPLADSPAGDAAIAQTAMPVTVELAAGSRATVNREANGVWKMRFLQASAYRSCTPAPPSVITVTVGGKRLPADPGGYTYQSDYGEYPGGTPAPAEGTTHPLVGPAPPLALRLAGRMVLGQSMSEGGGWGGASQPLLRDARVEVLYPAPFTNQSLSVLVEDIGPGGIIDTHACMAEESASRESHCVLENRGPSAGFLYYPTSEGVMFVQVHRNTDRIGVVPFGGIERPLGVTRWAGWVKTPWVQYIAAAMLLMSALLQGWVAFLETRSRVSAPRENRPVDDRANSPSG